ncbi:MAG: hypothetical protein ACOY41_12920 [Pseudomonadota bacterium]
MHSFLLRRAMPALAITLLLTACGGGDSPAAGSAGTPLGSANRESAATDTLGLTVDGSLATSLNGYYVPAATVAAASSGPDPRFSLRTLGTVLQRQAQESPSPAPGPAIPSPLGVATTDSTSETTACPGGGSYTVTSGTGNAVWVYSACVDGEGITLNGQVTSQQLDDVSYQGDFSAFSVTVPDTPTVRVQGRLVYSSNATATELTSPQLRLSIDNVFTLTLSDYLLRITDEGTQTKLEARGQALSGGAISYHVRFDNTASGDTDQAPFYLNDGDLYPYTGSLEIQDTLSGSRIIVSALDNTQVLITYKIGSQAELVAKSWSELL